MSDVNIASQHAVQMAQTLSQTFYKDLHQSEDLRFASLCVFSEELVQYFMNDGLFDTDTLRSVLETAVEQTQAQWVKQDFQKNYLQTQKGIVFPKVLDLNREPIERMLNDVKAIVRDLRNDKNAEHIERFHMFVKLPFDSTTTPQFFQSFLSLAQKPLVSTPEDWKTSGADLVRRFLWYKNVSVTASAFWDNAVKDARAWDESNDHIICAQCWRTPELWDAFCRDYATHATTHAHKILQSLNQGVEKMVQRAEAPDTVAVEVNSSSIEQRREKLLSAAAPSPSGPLL